MDLRLHNKAIVVTGASRGIGAATALTLAQEGAHVAIGARSGDGLHQVEADIRAAGGVAVAVAADLTTTDGIARLCSCAVEKLGGIDGLVCCVGATPFGAFEAVDDASWETAITTKLMSTVRTVRAVIPSLRARGGGRIVIVAGNAAHDPPPMMVTSAAINAALGALTSSLARAYASEGIAVNCINPGPTQTARYDGLVAAHRHAQDFENNKSAELDLLRRIPDGRPGTPQEIAALIAVLLSPISDHVNGAPLVVDSGQTWAR